MNLDCPVCAADPSACAGAPAAEGNPGGSTEGNPEGNPGGSATPGNGLSRASGTIVYLGEDGSTQTYNGPFDSVTSETTELNGTGGGWYLVSGEVTLPGRLTVNGEVHLILADGADLTATGGIKVSEGNSLTITAQSTNEGTMGKLTADASGSEASAGSIAIWGGEVTATGGNGTKQYGGAA